jgi:hypothetical protein
MIVTADSVRIEIMGHVKEAVRANDDGCGLVIAWERTARLYQMTARRVRAYWHEEVKVVPAHEADRVRAHRKAILRERQKLLNHELETLQMRLAQLEGEV